MNIQCNEQEQKIIVRVPINLRRWGGKKVLVGPKGQDLRHLKLEIRKDEKLLKALARAYKWKKELALGKYRTAEEIADAEKIDKSYVQRMMRLLLLSPRIVEAIMNGQQPEGCSLAVIEKPFSPIWSEQEKHFGLSRK